MSMWSLRWHFTNKSVTGAPYSIKKVTVCHTAGHYGEEYDDWNSAVLRSRRNCSSDGAERTDDRKAFHARAVEVTEAPVFEQLAQGCWLKAEGSAEVERATVESQVRRPDHYTSRPATQDACATRVGLSTASLRCPMSRRAVCFEYLYLPIMTTQHTTLQHYTYKNHNTRTTTQLKRLIGM